MSHILKRIGTLLLTVVLTSAICIFMYYNDNKYHENTPQAIAGFLVVEEGELESTPLRHLVSEWSLYPDVLLTPEDFTNGSPKDYMVTTAIGEKTRFDSLGDKNDPHGCGSYVMNMVLPEGVQTYALEVPEIYSAYKLYVNDRLVLQMGDPEPESYTPRTQNRMVTFEASGRARILIAVSDYSHFYSGMVYPPAFGTPLAVNTTRGMRMGIALFVDTLALLAAALALYFGLRMKHQNAKLFSLLCVVMCVFTSYSLVHSVLALPILPWYALEMTSGYLLSLLLVILHNRICDVDLYAKRISTAVVAAVCAIALCYGLSSASLTVPVMRAFSTMIFWYKLALPGYLLVTGFLALRGGENEKATPLFYASIVYATTFVWDRIFPAYEPILSGWFIEWGSLALVGAIGYTLWRDITTAYANGIIFAQEHRMVTRQLSMQMEYAKHLQRSSEAGQRQAHDFRHQFRTVLSLATQLECTAEMEDSKQQLLDCISASIQDSVPIYQNLAGHLCENVALDALLQYYSAVATESGIRAKFRVSIPDTFPMSDTELCAVFGNLMENAVEACRRNKGEKNFILVTTEITPHNFLLIVINSYDGNYQQSDARFLSRKSEEPRFGIGLESVRHTVEKHGGVLFVLPKEEKFNVSVTLRLP